MAGETCPLLAKKCIEHKCKFYLHESWTNSETGETKTGFECLFVLQYQLGRQQVVEQIRAQAVGDKIATEVNRGFGGLTMLALEARNGGR